MLQENAMGLCTNGVSRIEVRDTTTAISNTLVLPNGNAAAMAWSLGEGTGVYLSDALHVMVQGTPAAEFSPTQLAVNTLVANAATFAATVSLEGGLRSRLRHANSSICSLELTDRCVVLHHNSPTLSLPSLESAAGHEFLVVYEAPVPSQLTLLPVEGDHFEHGLSIAIPFNTQLRLFAGEKWLLL